MPDPLMRWPEDLPMQSLYGEDSDSSKIQKCRQPKGFKSSTNSLQETLERFKQIQGLPRWNLFKHSEELSSWNLPENIFICFHTSTIMNKWSLAENHSTSPWKCSDRFNVPGIPIYSQNNLVPPQQGSGYGRWDEHIYRVGLIRDVFQQQDQK